MEILACIVFMLYIIPLHIYFLHFAFRTSAHLYLFSSLILFVTWCLPRLLKAFWSQEVPGTGPPCFRAHLGSPLQTRPPGPGGWWHGREADYGMTQIEMEMLFASYI